jgi:hypothetical protein
MASRARALRSNQPPADKLIGRMFARAKNAQEKRYAASTKDVGRLIRLFRATITALGVAQESERDGFAVVDEAVGWPKLLKARNEIDAVADLAETDPLVRAADRYLTLRRFAPILIEALIFRAARDNDPMLAALRLLQELNRASKREVPADAPMPFRKDWKKSDPAGKRGLGRDVSAKADRVAGSSPRDAPRRFGWQAGVAPERRRPAQTGSNRHRPASRSIAGRYWAPARPPRLAATVRSAPDYPARHRSRRHSAGVW